MILIIVLANTDRCDDITIVDRVSEPRRGKDAFYLGCSATNRYRTVGTNSVDRQSATIFIGVPCWDD